MNKIASFCSFLMLITGCKSQPKHSTEMQQLLENTKKNLVFVEGGTFAMGHPNAYKARPVHEVTLDNYSISKYETTFEEYDTYTRVTDKRIIREDYREIVTNGPKYGAWGMDWPEARAYCQWLGKQLEIPMDLPTEAQWEYAARSRGKDVEHATNNGKIEGGDNDNYGDGEVGSFPPNPLGLYDMSGGRPEWILDWYAGYPRTPVNNPMRDSIKFVQKRVVRGIHTLSYSVYSRAADPPALKGAGAGIRCVCNQKTPVNYN